MYEELIYRIKGTDFERPDCTPFDCGAFGLLAEAGRAISALQSENAELQEENGCLRHNVASMQVTLDQQAQNCEELLAEKDKEIERLMDKPS